MHLVAAAEQRQAVEDHAAGVSVIVWEKIILLGAGMEIADEVKPIVRMHHRG
jgi:hypothetical protein